MYVIFSRKEEAMNQERRNKECDYAYDQTSTRVDSHCGRQPGQHQNGTLGKRMGMSIQITWAWQMTLLSHLLGIQCGQGCLLN